MKSSPVSVSSSLYQMTYRAGRRATSNFETCGGEKYCGDDHFVTPYAAIIPLPVKNHQRIVVATYRKEDQMSNENTSGTNSSTESRETDWTQGDDHTRRQSFRVSQPVVATISTRSGDVHVRASDENELTVTLRARSKRDEYVLDLAEVHFDASRGHLEIQSRPDGWSGPFRSANGPIRKSWFNQGSSDVDVVVAVPKDSSLTVRTASGDVMIQGPLDSVSVATASGDVNLVNSSLRREAKTASGDLSVDNVHDVARLRSASGDVTLRSGAATTEIATASGDVELFLSQPGDVVVKAVSGDVKIQVAHGLAVDVNGNTVSGDLGSNIDLSATGDTLSDEGVISIKVNTVSGDIRVDKAS
ncbi:MAG: DUF4097 family beta strand repeat-containing protein [Acidimicrobiales bacterium]